MSPLPWADGPLHFASGGTDTPAAVPSAGAAGPASGATGPRKRRLRTLRRFALGAFALICIIGALQSRIAASHAQTRPDAERLQAVAQASALLFSPPPQPGSIAPVLATPEDTRGSGMLPAGKNGPDARPPPQSAFGPADIALHPATVPGPSAPANAALSGAPDAAYLHEADSNKADLHAPNSWTPARYPRPSRHEIPGAIEGYPPRYADGDALASLAITSSLRVFDGSNAPLRLIATRTDDGPARVQLQVRDAAGPMPASGGWLEAGDSPAPGWYVLSISRADVLLLSPLGNPLRLRLAPGHATGVGNSTAGTQAPSGQRRSDR